MSDGEGEILEHGVAHLSGADIVWVSFCTYMIVLMQLGFAWLEHGGVRSHNLTFILTKNLVNIAVGTLAWWVFGYGFAWGEDHEGFIGTSHFIGGQFRGTTLYAHWLLLWAFAITTCTIVPGAVAERLPVKTYLIYSFFLVAWIFPVETHWVWNPKGWLFKLDFHDVGGTSNIHMVGGSAGLMACLAAGRRKGRFEHTQADGSDGFSTTSVPFNVYATMLLIVCWFCFNGVYTEGASTLAQAEAIGLIGMNNMLSAATCGLLCYFQNLRDPTSNFASQANSLAMGILAGLVSITGAGDNVEPWAAVVIGAVGFFVFQGGISLLHKLKIDDPVDAAPMHMGCGIWGTIAVGIFDRKWGLIYTSEGHGIGVQFLGTVAILAWNIGFSGGFWLIARYFGAMRVSQELESYGDAGFEILAGNIDIKAIEGGHKEIKDNKSSNQLPLDTEMDFIKVKQQPVQTQQEQQVQQLTAPQQQTKRQDESYYDRISQFGPEQEVHQTPDYTKNKKSTPFF